MSRSEHTELDSLIKDTELNRMPGKQYSTDTNKTK